MGILSRSMKILRVLLLKVGSKFRTSFEQALDDERLEEYTGMMRGSITRSLGGDVHDEAWLGQVAGSRLCVACGCARA